MVADDIKEIGYEVYEHQHEIIRLQSDAINELIFIMSQYKLLNECDISKTKEKIELARQIKHEMNL